MYTTDERRSPQANVSNGKAGTGLERFFSKEAKERVLGPQTSEEWWTYICSAADARRRKMGIYPMAIYAGSSK